MYMVGVYMHRHITTNIFINSMCTCICAPTRDLYIVCVSGPADAFYNNPIEVNVQQPFVFCIVDTQIDLIIMTGQIVNPLSSRIL